MIRLSHPSIGTVFQFDEGVLNTIVIENKQFFHDFIADLYYQTLNVGGKIVLSNDFTPIDICKNLILINDFISFDINKKSLISKITSYFEKLAINENNYLKTNNLLCEIEKYGYDILQECPFSFEFEKLNISTLVKALGIKLNENYNNELEKIIDYLQLVREYEGDKLFVFVNIRCYFNDEQIESFVSTLLSKKFNIFFIESFDYCKLNCEKRVVIDKDLCEIY